MEALRKMVARLLRDTANKIDADTCEMSEAEAMDVLRALSHQRLSRVQAFTYLNMSRSRFDAHVAEGILPKGKKIRGFTELVWYKDELDEAVRKLKDKEKSV